MIEVDQVLTGPLFSEPMRVVTVQTNGLGSWTVGLVGLTSGQFRSVALSRQDSDHLIITSPTPTYMGDGSLLRLGIQAYSFAIAYQFDPYLGLSLSRGDPLACALERRAFPGTVAQFIHEAAGHVPYALQPVAALPRTFDPVGPIPELLRHCEEEATWNLPSLASWYPRFSTDRETAEQHKLEWVTPGHPLFEALRRHALTQAQEPFAQGACFYCLDYTTPVRLDFYRPRVVDGLGQEIHERLFAVEIATGSEPKLREPGLLGNMLPATVADSLPELTSLPKPDAWLLLHVLQPYLDEVRKERLKEIDRITRYVEDAPTELTQRADEQLGQFVEEAQRRDEGSAGLLAQAQVRHQELLHHRERRRQGVDRQRALTLQGVERFATALVLPHPESNSPEVQGLKPDPQVEAVAMQVVMEHERAAGYRVDDVHEKNLGYDLASLAPNSGELRLIQVRGLSEATGRILLKPIERQVAEDHRKCYWLYIVTNCKTAPRLQEPVKDPARFPWREVKKVDHYYLSVLRGGIVEFVGHGDLGLASMASGKMLREKASIRSLRSPKNSGSAKPNGRSIPPSTRNTKRNSAKHPSGGSRAP